MLLNNFLPFNTLNRKIFMEMLRMFILCAVFLLSIMLLGRGLNMRGMLLGIQPNFFDFLLLFAYMAPQFLLIVIPFACMCSIFLTFLRMNSDRELIALRAGGINISQLLPAPMCLAAICFVCTLWASLYGISSGMDNFRSTVLHIARTKTQLKLQPGVFNQDISGLTLYARKVNPKTGQLEQIIFEDTTKAVHNRITILAPTGDIITDNKQGELIFSLRDGRIYQLNKERVNILAFEKYNIRISLDKIFSGSGPLLKPAAVKDMSWDTLLEEIKKTPDDSAFALEIQKRWALPAACFVLGFFAIPLASAFEGARRQTGIVITLGAVLLYYALHSTGLTLAEADYLSPAIVMWGPNVLFLLSGLLGMYMTTKENLIITLPHFTLQRTFVKILKKMRRV